MHACVTDLLEGKELVICMVLTMYFILSAVLKRRPANGVDMRKIYFFPISSHKTGYTFQLSLISDAMRLEDDSCTDKVKEMNPRSNSST